MTAAGAETARQRVYRQPARSRTSNRDSSPARLPVDRREGNRRFGTRALRPRHSRRRRSRRDHSAAEVRARRRRGAERAAAGACPGAARADCPATNSPRRRRPSWRSLARELPKRLDAFDLHLDRARRVEATAGGEARIRTTSGRSSRARPRRDTYRVCGVVRHRHPRGAEEAHAAGGVGAASTATRSCRRPRATSCSASCRGSRTAAVHSADVRVRPGGDLPGTVAAIDAMGFRTISAAKWFASAKREVTLIAAGLNLFAMIALFVAGHRHHEHAGDERGRADEGDRHPASGGGHEGPDHGPLSGRGDVHRPGRQPAWASALRADWRCRPTGGCGG